MLVTGASGFLGRQAVPLLADSGYEVHALCYPEPVEFGGSAQVYPHVCDLLNGDEVSALVTEVKPTHLLHFAWYTEHGKYWASIENLKWVKASIDLAMAFVDEGGRRLVVAGTCAEYGWEYGYLSEGSTPLMPATLYGVCKNGLREILAGFAKETGISTAWGRIFFPYGPNERRERLVPDVIVSLLEDRPALCTHGDQVRDFIHVEDAASAFAGLLSSDVEGPVNIASGEPVALKTVIQTIADVLGKSNLVKLGAIPAREGEAPLVVADVRRLKEEVGWEPQFTIQSGLESTIEWWRNNIKT